MNTITVRESTQAPVIRLSASALDGTSTLVRFIMRRERIRLPAWLLGFTFMLSFFLRAVGELTGTEEQRQDLLRFMEGPSGAIFGPGYGRYDITPERYVVGVYGLIFFVLTALMSIFLVARHTRTEEENGHAELIRSNAVGRHAHLSAALIVAIGTNAVLALLLTGVMTADGLNGSDGLLFGASAGAVGLVFTGITALTVQLTEHSRTATGISGAVLGVAWVVRTAGDMISDYGSALSWFSPLAWSNQTRAYVDGRWWPLLLSVGLAAAAAACAYVLSVRRDIGAGMIATRAGAPVATPWLRSPLAAVFRLQRGSLISWTVALAVFGFLFGALGDQTADPEGMSASRIDLFGGSVETLLGGYLGVMTLFTTVLSSIMVHLGVQAMRHEETRGRAEPVLATATSRWVWFGSYILVMGLGSIVLLLVAGFTTGAGTAIVVSDGSWIWEVMGAHLAYVPGVLVVLGIAALLYGVLPRAIGVTWVVIGLSLFVGFFGTVMDLPGWIRNASPFEHIGRPPLESISWSAAMLLLILAAGLMAAGLAAFRYRDLETK